MRCSYTYMLLACFVLYSRSSHRYVRCGAPFFPPQKKGCHQPREREREKRVAHPPRNDGFCYALLAVADMDLGNWAACCTFAEAFSFFFHVDLPSFLSFITHGVMGEIWGRVPTTSVIICLLFYPTLKKEVRQRKKKVAQSGTVSFFNTMLVYGCFCARLSRCWAALYKHLYTLTYVWAEGASLPLSLLRIFSHFRHPYLPQINK